MTQAAGAILIMTSCTLLGSAAYSFFRMRANVLEAFWQLITHIQSEIDGSLAPLDRIYASFRCPTLEKCGFMDSLTKDGGVTAIKSHGTRLCLCANERELLIQFFKELGRHGAEGEAKHCAYYEARLRELAGSVRGDAAAKKRLCLSLGVLFGIMLSVILI